MATRADIIEKLLSSFLMEKKGHELHITSKGKQLLALVPEDLKSPELTAQWELRLQSIAKGDVYKRQILRRLQVLDPVIPQQEIMPSCVSSAYFQKHTVHSYSGSSIL